MLSGTDSMICSNVSRPAAAAESARALASSIAVLRTLREAAAAQSTGSLASRSAWFTRWRSTRSRLTLRRSASLAAAVRASRRINPNTALSDL